jgi:RNA-directed DNA polymerase
MEQRDQQRPNLTHGTQTAYKSGIAGQNERITEQLEFLSSWQTRISRRAQDKDALFSNLMKHINKDTLYEAYRALDGSKALGVDRISKATYGENLEQNLKDLLERVHKGSYRPQPKKEVLIPKANGKTRPIAIAGFEDKLVDWVLGKILAILYEPLFIRTNFGYRQKKSAHDAIDVCYCSLEKNNRKHVVEIDFSKFFNTIPHGKMLKILGQRIADKRFLRLIRRILNGEIATYTGEVIASEIGTPQGGIASPILANIYLNVVLDQWFLQNFASRDSVIVRYADDAIFFFKTEEEASRFLQALKRRVEEFQLILNEEKCRTLTFDKRSNEHFHFLGFTFYWGRLGRKRTLKLKTQKEKLIKSIQEFYSWIKENRNTMKLKELWELAKSKIRGHLNYYGYLVNKNKIRHFYCEAVRSLFKWINRRSQRLSYTWEGFQERIQYFPLIPPWDEIAWKQPKRRRAFIRL